MGISLWSGKVGGENKKIEVKGGGLITVGSPISTIEICRRGVKRMESMK